MRLNLNRNQKIVIMMWAIVLVLLTAWIVRWEERRSVTQSVIDYAYKMETSGGDTSSRVSIIMYGRDTVWFPTYVLRSVIVAGLKRENMELRKLLKSSGKEPLIKEIKFLRADTAQKQKYILALINAK
jgi:hypothetical protein